MDTTAEAIHFSEMPYQRPNLDEVAKTCEGFINDTLKCDGDTLVATFKAWDKTRQDLQTLKNLVEVKYTLNTRDEACKKEQRFFDQALPQMEEIEANTLQAFLAHPHAEALDRAFGSRLRQLLTIKVESFDPKIKDHLRREADLCTQYTELQAGAEIPFRGETHNLSGLQQFFEDSDRTVRRGSHEAYCDHFAANGDELDQIYDELVQIRHERAQLLGYPSFTPLRYRLMQRLDYGPDEIASFRGQVLSHVVPKAVQVRRRQAERLGIDAVKFWDERCFHSGQPLVPLEEGPFIVEQTKRMYREFSADTHAFFHTLSERGLFDITPRMGKAFGGYCTSLDAYGVPYIFSSFAGGTGIWVLVHECGHALQYYLSRHQPVSEYLWPTMEAAEIFSMGMEYLSWPWMKLYFGAQAERFCDRRLQEAIVDMPYMCAVDEFQHEVYRDPHCGPKGRRDVWKALEKRYLPWRDYGDLGHWNEGNFWQFKQHIFTCPLYYIDYALASLCALQFHQQAQVDFEETVKRYLAVCPVGGSQSFGEIVNRAGLRNPLDEGCVQEVVSAID